MTSPGKRVLSTATLNKYIGQAASLPALDLNLWPESLKTNVEQLSSGLSVPPLGVLTSLIVPTQLAMTYSFVKLEESDWKEPVIIWVLEHMATGTRKSAIHSFTGRLNKVVDRYE